jgi:hypothetical protein
VGTPDARPQRRRYPMGPKGYQRSDERLREEISERLMEAYHIDSSDVTVQVLGARVVLEGTVPDRHMKHAIEDLADAAPGVQDVENRIRVVVGRDRVGWDTRDTAQPLGSRSAGADAGSLGSAGSGPLGSGSAGSSANASTGSSGGASTESPGSGSAASGTTGSGSAGGGASGSAGSGSTGSTGNASSGSRRRDS